MHVVVEQTADLRRENAPVVDEVAGVILDRGENQRDFRDIVLTERSLNGSITMSYCRI